jgi:hypothetical protein
LYAFKSGLVKSESSGDYGLESSVHFPHKVRMSGPSGRLLELEFVIKTKIIVNGPVLLLQSGMHLILGLEHNFAS